MEVFWGGFCVAAKFCALHALLRGRPDALGKSSWTRWGTSSPSMPSLSMSSASLRRRKMRIKSSCSEELKRDAPCAFAVRGASTKADMSIRRDSWRFGAQHCADHPLHYLLMLDDVFILYIWRRWLSQPPGAFPVCRDGAGLGANPDPVSASSDALVRNSDCRRA